MAQRIDFSIRNSIPNKTSYLQLFSAVNVNFGLDKALMGDIDHCGEVVMVTDSLTAGVEYLTRIQVETVHLSVPFRLVVTDDEREVIFEQSHTAKNGKLNYIIPIPDGLQGQLRISLTFDTKSVEFKRIPKDAPLGDFTFFSALFEEM